MHTGFSRCQGERVKILLFEGKNTMLAPCAFGDRPPKIGEGIGTTFERSNPSPWLPMLGHDATSHPLNET
jgi:hypothetical protein